MLTWLEWEDKQYAPELEQEDFKLQLLEDGREIIFPEALNWYRRWKKYGSIRAGGYSNQAYFQLWEFDVVERAIHEYNVIKFVREEAKRNKDSSIGGG